MNNPNVEILTTQDGSHTLLQQDLQIAYHSRFGAIQESNHVFIKAGLHEKIAEQNDISILEFGFGTGLNVLLTALDVITKSANIQYTTLEAYPLSANQVAALNYIDLLNGGIATDYFHQLHQSEWETWHQLSANFSFQKKFERFEDFKALHQYDLVFYDAFAPEAQPELWNEIIFQKVFACMSPNAILTTYCAKGAVKRTLKAIGFQVETLAGPPGKREMIRARKVA